MEAPRCETQHNQHRRSYWHDYHQKGSELGRRVFEEGYHDRIINRPGMLENIKRYMAENPLRARIREECPRLMERQLHLWIGGREYAAFGNLFLLKYPINDLFRRLISFGAASSHARV